MSPLAERALVDEEVFTSSMESIEVVAELEHRRALVAEGRSRLLSEDEAHSCGEEPILVPSRSYNGCDK